MESEISLSDNEGLKLNSSERRATSILLVDPESNIRRTMRQSLIGLGYATVNDSGDHAQALQKIEDRQYSHMIFDAKRGRLAAREFLQRAFELKRDLIAIASSYEPTVDDVFDLLLCGARGYVVKPFTTETLDNTIVLSTKGEPVSDVVLSARNRNEALAAFVMAALDKLAIIQKQARTFETARHDLPARRLALRRAIDLAQTFTKGGPLMLRETLVELCLAQAEGPSSRLGKVRRRIDERRKSESLEVSDDERKQIEAALEL